jgi:hypothetical protein
VPERTGEGNLLRKLLVDMYCWSSLSAEEFRDLVKRIPGDIIFELFMAERTRRENPEMENALLSPTKNNYVDENVIDRRIHPADNAPITIE